MWPLVVIPQLEASPIIESPDAQVATDSFHGAQYLRGTLDLLCMPVQFCSAYQDDIDTGLDCEFHVHQTAGVCLTKHERTILPVS